MGVRRLVRVEAVIERPPPPSWIGELPFPERQAYWPGTMLDWRCVDKRTGTWTAYVQYRRDGLTYSHWLCSELHDVDPAEPLTDLAGIGTFGAVEPDDQAHDGVTQIDDEGLEREADVMGANALPESR
jgi:hypothetical protein